MAKPKGKTDSWMPLYIGDYIADTMHLTTEQHGAYLLLIMAYWRKGGPLPSDPAALASIARMSMDAWSIHQALLMQFFDTSSSNAWVHHRIEKELTDAGIKRAKAVEKAKKAADARWNDAPSNPQAMHKECPSPPASPSVSNETDISTDTGKPAAAKQKRKTRLPDDFCLTDDRKAAAAKYWLDHERTDLIAATEFERFTAYHRSRGSTMVDWDAAWQTWYGNALKFNKPPNGSNGASHERPQNAADRRLDVARATRDYKRAIDF